ncbi:hypothetical protein DJ564_04770 [Pseudomonas sp. 31-12]|nr:hypothetical protein DJ564_04770 [Pseudomonas sp. 31-12]
MMLPKLHPGQVFDEFLNAVKEPLRRIEVGLDIDDKQGVMHGVGSALDESVGRAWQLYDSL